MSAYGILYIFYFINNINEMIKECSGYFKPSFAVQFLRVYATHKLVTYLLNDVGYKYFLEILISVFINCTILKVLACGNRTVIWELGSSPRSKLG